MSRDVIGFIGWSILICWMTAKLWLEHRDLRRKAAQDQFLRDQEQMRRELGLPTPAPYINRPKGS